MIKNTALSLEEKVLMLQYELNVIKSLLSHDPPPWAENIIKMAKDKGMKHSPYGESLDTMRILDLLNKLGILT